MDITTGRIAEILQENWNILLFIENRLLQRRAKLSQSLRKFKIKFSAQICFSKRNIIFLLRMEIIAEESKSHKLEKF